MNRLMKGVKKRLSHTEGELKDSKELQQHQPQLTAGNTGTAVITNGSAAITQTAAQQTLASAPAASASAASSPMSAAAHPPVSASAAASTSASDNLHLPRCRQSRSVSRDVIIHNLPALRDAAPSSRKALLLKKLRLCSFVFSFDESQLDSAQEQKEKELKRSTLLELVNYLTVFKPAFHDDELQAMFDMLQLNLFRPLPPSTFELTGVYNPEEDEPASEPAWVHLQVLYEFLLRLATSTETDAKLMDKYFTRKFILSLLELFDSEDPRERDYLKTILHRIYGNFMSLRPFIRRAINNVFYRFIYETDRHNGIAELLEILGSIINGFALPLKEQHKQFLIRVLLPLHKVTHVAIFHPQLSYCLPEADSRVMTDCGLLFLHQLEARIAAGDTVLYACYDIASDSLVYRPGRLVLPPPPARLLDFCSPDEAASWADDTDEYCTRLQQQEEVEEEPGEEQIWLEDNEDVDAEFMDEDDVEAVEQAACRSRRLALRVTPGHRMFVQRCDHLPYEVVPASHLPVPSCECDNRDAADLRQRCRHARAAVRMLSCAASGYTAKEARERKTVQRRLHLSDEQFLLFLELFGFWLTGGSLLHHSSGAASAVTFRQVREEDGRWLDCVLQQLGLKQSELELQSCGLHRVTAARWLDYFSEQSALALPSPSSSSHPSCSRRSDSSTTAPRDLQLNSSVVTQSPSSSPAAVTADCEDALTVSQAPVEQRKESKAVKSFPRWMLQELSKDEIRLLVRGLCRANGRHAQRDTGRRRQMIFTSCAAFRDQLVQAALHCGFSPSPLLLYRAGAVRGYLRRSQLEDVRLYSRKHVSSLSATARREYRPVMARRDCWAVCWTDPSSASDVETSRPTALRQSGIREHAYAPQRDGRVWCVQVEHEDHLIIAQRARRGADGAVAHQSPPVVTGNCVTQFLEKDQTLAPAIIAAILKFWPLTASKKELMFLNELEEILDRIQSQHLGDSEVPLFTRIAAAINSPHFQVSERAIYILNNDIIVRFVSGKRDVLVPILAKSLIGNTNMADEAEQEQVAALVEQTMNTIRLQRSADDAAAAAAVGSTSAVSSLSSSSPSSSPVQDGLSPYPLSPLLLSPHSLHLGHASQGRPGHWNATIIELTSDIIKLLAEMEGGLLEKMMADREKEVEDRVRNGEDRVRRWEELRKIRARWEEERRRGGGAAGAEMSIAVATAAGGGGEEDDGAMEQ